MTVARRVPVAAAALLLLLTWQVRAQKPRKIIDGESVSALRTWVDAVGAHTPGRADAGVVTVAGFSYETREVLNTGMTLFLTALMGWSYDAANNKAAETIAAMGHAAGKDFLKRAAVLHSDVAAYGYLHPLPSAGGPKPAPNRQRELQLGTGAAPQRLPDSEPISPLLMADRVLLDKDGEIVGEVVSSWNWPFARSLLDLLGAGARSKIFSDGRPERATDPFVSAWYHATTAYMFVQGLYGDATPHLHHASMALPDDAIALFDRACYAEILGLPMHQALAPAADVGQRARSSGTLTWVTPRSGPALRIPAAAAANAEAEQLFRRTLTVDPSLVEARVRLARLLELRGRHQEAATELRTALSQSPAGAVAFYARLFAGRTAQELGNLDDARQQLDEALRLFPDAQSALLASSQVALRRADVAAALKPVERLGARSVVFDADPWWAYHLGAGRNADELLKAVWARVPR